MKLMGSGKGEGGGRNEWVNGGNRVKYVKAYFCRHGGGDKSKGSTMRLDKRKMGLEAKHVDWGKSKRKKQKK
jgi:hypothetical protein